MTGTDAPRPAGSPVTTVQVVTGDGLAVFLAAQRLPELPGDFVGGGIDSALDNFVGTGQRVIQGFFDRRLADPDQPCLAAAPLPRGVPYILSRRPSPPPPSPH